MRTFLVSLLEVKYYIVETDNDAITPEEMAEEFVAHDGNHVMHIKLAGKAIPEMDVIELGDPNLVFEDGSGDGDLPWIN